MKNIKFKVYCLRWEDGHVHCEKCGAIMTSDGQSFFCPVCDISDFEE